MYYQPLYKPFRLRLWVFNISLCLLIVGYSYSSAANSKTAKSKRKSAVQVQPVSQNSYSLSSSTFSNTPVTEMPKIQVASNMPQNGDEYLPISFGILGDYDYEEPFVKNGKLVIPNQIPEKIKSLNGKKVSIRGYFYPVEISEGGTIKNFMLLRNQIYCCFGDAVQINEWISATMSNGKPLKTDYTSTPITLYGTLEVGEKFENNFLSNLYRMKADRLVVEK